MCRAAGTTRGRTTRSPSPRQRHQRRPGAGGGRRGAGDVVGHRRGHGARRRHPLHVEMAQDQQEKGQYKPAVDLAGNVVDTQTAEIEKMKSLLGS
nr:DUF305 domain-containing protein [Nocardioides astragali]